MNGGVLFGTEVRNHPLPSPKVTSALRAPRPV